MNISGSESEDCDFSLIYGEYLNVGGARPFLLRHSSIVFLLAVFRRYYYVCAK